MSWKPIEEYDAMNVKPRAVFLVGRSKSGRNTLGRMISTERRFGRREVIAFCEIPDLILFPEQTTETEKANG